MFGACVDRRAKQSTVEFAATRHDERRHAAVVGRQRDTRLPITVEESGGFDRDRAEALDGTRGTNQLERAARDASAARFFAWMTSVDDADPCASARQSITSPRPGRAGANYQSVQNVDGGHRPFIVRYPRWCIH